MISQLGSIYFIAQHKRTFMFIHRVIQNIYAETGSPS